MEGKEFTLLNGRVCSVVSVRPRFPHLVRREYADGWLVFETSLERRRLAPIPTEWHEADESTLREWWATAESHAKPKYI